MQRASPVAGVVRPVGPGGQTADVESLVPTHPAPGAIVYPDAIWLEKASTGYTGTVVSGHHLDIVPVPPNPVVSVNERLGSQAASA